MKGHAFHVESEEDLVVERNGEDGCRVMGPEFELELGYDALYELALNLASIISELDREDGEELKNARAAKLRLV